MSKTLRLVLLLLISVNAAFATTYYSQNQPSQSFADLTNWNTATDGSGSAPVLADLTSGAHVFVVQSGHTVQIDADISVDGLVANGLLEVGNDATARTITVGTTIFVDATGTLRTQNSTVTHSMTLTGTNATVSNLGSLLLWRDGNSLTDLTITGGTAPTISANSTTYFNALTYNGGGTLSASGSMRVYGDLDVTNNSTITGSATYSIRADLNVEAGSTQDISGIVSLEQFSDQAFNCNGTCSMATLILNNGPGAAGVKTVNGKVTVSTQLRIYDDAVLAGSDTLEITGRIRMDNATGWTSSGVVLFGTSGATREIRGAGGTNQFGTSEFVIRGNTTFFGTNSTDYIIDNDFTINDGVYVYVYNGSTLSQATPTSNTFTLGAASRLYVQDANNFPSGFATYTLDPTSWVFYDDNGGQLIESGVTYGNLFLRYSTKLANGPITVVNDLTLRGSVNFLLTDAGEDLTVGDDINGTNGENSTITSTNTLTLNGVDIDQTLSQYNSYTFQDVVIDNVGPITNIRTKNIDADMTINGDFTVTNSGGDASNLLIVDIDANNLNANGGTFTLGANVELRTSGATSFEDMFDATLPSFGAAALDNASTIEFDANVDQEIPGITYGNIFLDNDGNKTLTGNVIINGNVDGDRDNLVFVDNGNDVTLYGNWDFGDFGDGLNRTNMTGNFTFAGGNQTSNESNFNNVTFAGTGTKTFNYTVDAACGFTINNGVTVTSIYDIYVGCDFTTIGTGKLTHNAQEIFFDGTTGDQTITIADPTTTYFNNLELTNSSGSVILASDLDVNGFVDFQNGTDVTLNIDDDTLYVGGDFLMYTEDRFSTTNGTLVLDGAADQQIRNGYASQVYNNIYFRTGGEKRLSSNTFDIDGDVIGSASVTFDMNGQDANVAGDYTHFGAIGGGTGDILEFDGANQTITALEFNTIYLGGTDTKTLGANISVKGNLHILSGSTLDVSGSNYDISVEGNWRNDFGGAFTAQSGKVTFIGSNTDIYTGGAGAGTSFNDVEINLTGIGFNASIDNGGTADDDMDIDGDFTITSGQFFTEARNVYVGGNMAVGANGRYYGTNASNDLIFDGTGSKTWTPGATDIYRDIIFDGVGSTWSMQGDATTQWNRAVTINNGKLDLNHNSLTLTGNNSADFTINGANAELEIDSAAVLTMGSGNNIDLLNAGGTITLLGTANGGVAKITSTGTFNFDQTSGTIAAQYYQINGTRNQGLDIQGGTIDATNNFSNGTFSGGTGSAYLTLHSGAFAADASISGVVFNESSNGNPTSNVDYSTGAQIITFEDAFGTAAGPSREEDTPDGGAADGQIRWTYTSSFVWVGKGADNNWNTAANWYPGIPTLASNVILNNDSVTTDYTVNVAASALAGNLTIQEAGGGVDIRLNVDANLNVDGDFLMGAGTIVEQVGATDTIFVAGSWSNTSGTFLGDNSVLVFDPNSGNHTISTNSSTNGNRDLNEVIIRGGGYYTLSDVTEFQGDLTVVGGTIDIGDANNELQFQGNFTISDSGSFVHSNGDLIAEGSSGTQEITTSIDPIYDFTFRNGAKKNINSNMIVERDFIIQASSDSVLATDKTIYVNRDWRNLKGDDGFAQTTGQVIFNGNITQDIGQAGDASTIFNNVIFQNTGQKIINQNIQTTGNLLILMGSSGAVVEIDNGATITGTGSSNDFLMQDGVLRIRSANGFPSGYETLDLLGGTVEYRSDGIAQNVEGATYYNLTIREQGGSQTTKTALGDITVENNFRNNDDVNTELNMDCNTLTINGSMTIRSGAPDIDWGSGCTTTCGTGGTLVLGEDVTTINTNFTSFHNLVVDNNGVVELRLTNDITVEGNLTLRNGSWFDMRTFTVTNTCGDAPNPTVFAAEDATEIETQVAAGLNALPANFGNFNLSVNSLVEYQLAGDQDVYTASGTLIYGDLQLENSGNKIIDGTLNVDGDFDMGGTAVLVDNNFSSTFTGDLVAFTTYTPSAGTSLLFDGNDQVIRLDVASSIDFREVEFTGAGTKSFGDDETYNFLEDFKVGPTAVIDWTSSDNDVSFSGDSIIVEGTLDHNGGDNDFRFNKAGTQVVDLGTHTLAHMEVKTGATVDLINTGLNITGNGGTQNFFEVETGATINMDTMTHYLGQDDIILTGTFNSSNADLVFNQTGQQDIDAFVANDVTFTGTGDKDMNGIWRMNNVTISGSADVDFNGQDTMVVRGNFACTADITREDGVIRFEMDDSDPRTIQTNDEPISQVKFVSVGGNTATYTMQDNLYIDDTLRIGSGAILDLEGNTLRMGQPADGGGEDESLYIEAGGELQIDAGASALFDCNGGIDANVDVYGTLSVVGSSLQTANISRLSGNAEIDIDIFSGATIAAQNYSIANTVDAGILVASGATIDPSNNFSNGSFSNMQEGVGAVYLQIEADVSSIGSITGVTFNHSGPTVGSDYNVRRDRLDGGVLTFDDDILGQLGTFEYENEVAAAGTGDRIVWPSSSETNWIGGAAGAENDWFTAANWDNGVPNENTTAIISVRPFLPIIGSGGADTAKCKQLELSGSGASLTMNDGIPLEVKNDLIQGSGSESTTITINNASSDIIVGKSWTTGTGAAFTDNAGAKVLFNSASGSATLDVEPITFNNVEFNGSSSFNINGDFNVAGDVIITTGSLNPSSNNYVYTIGGDWDASGGSFNSAVNGTVLFNGAIQTITAGDFDNVTFDGGGCDTLKGTVIFNDDLIINNCVVAATGSAVDMNGDVTINASGSFDDGGETHTFSGDNWTGTGGFPSNTGTIIFDETGGTQNIFASKFNNVRINSSSRIDLEGAVDVTGDFYISNTINSFYTQMHLLDNTTGTGTFTLEDGENIYVDGANNFPSNFSTYTIAESSNTRYNGTGNQTIRGGITYGNLILTNANTKTLSGNIGVLNDLSFNSSTLDVSTSNYNISVGDNWNNDANGSFIARKGTVTFDGSGDQAIAPGDPSDGTKSFWNVTVANTSAADLVDINGADIDIDSTLNVTDGIFTLAGVGNGWTAYVGGSLSSSGGGSFANTGTYYLDSDDNATLDISAPNSTFRDIVIDATSSTTYQLSSDLTVDGNFTLTQGIFNGNQNDVELGTDINDAVVISGTYQVFRGELALGRETSLNVTSSGVIEVIGTQNLPAVVTRRYDNSDYNFSVDGTIRARNYVFQYMSAQGISINSGATIDPSNNFSDGTFTNPATGGVCLRIENTQRLTQGNRIENANFPIDPGAGTFNVSKVIATTDTIEFYNSTGELAGELKDNDPSDMIIWTGPVEMVWTGAVDNDWFKVGNWQASSGPTQVPDSTFNVRIPLVINQPLIDTTGAQALSLIMEAGVTLTVQTDEDNGSDLVIFDGIIFEGLLKTETTNDVIEVRGNWSRVNGGSYVYTSGGKILYSGDEGGTPTINNGTSPFYDLEIDRTGFIFLATDVKIDNDLLITNGTLDVTSDNYNMEIGGSFFNNGGFIARSGSVEMTTSATDTIEIGTQNFYDLKMSGTGNIILNTLMAVYNRFDMENGTFDLNGQSVFFGDASGTDVVEVSGGELIADAGTIIRMAGGSSFFVSSGGTYTIVGDDLSNLAMMQNQGGTTTYDLVIQSGATIAARFYQFSYLGTNGLDIQSGGTIDATNNLSYGTFTNGASGGTYVTLRNNQSLTGVNRIEYVRFATDPGGSASNIYKTNAIGDIEMYYAYGPFQGEDFDRDANDLVDWDANIVWTGATDTDWDEPGNWDPGLGLPVAGLIPEEFTDVIIPDAATTPNDPILNVLGYSKDVEIQTDGLLTMSSDNDIIASGDVLVNGTLTVSGGSDSFIRLYGSWNSTAGTFNNGGSSEVNFLTETGTVTIASADPFCGLVINSLSPSTATIQTGSSIDVDCDFIINRGTFEIGDPSHTFNLAGNWTNFSSTASGGFTESTGTVIFDGTTVQGITHAAGEESFYNLTISNSGSVDVNINDNVIVANDLNIGASSILDGSAFNLTVNGNWTNANANGYRESTGRVLFQGTSQQTIVNSAGIEIFNNVTLNNSTAGSAFVLGGDVAVSNSLVHSDGIVETGSNVLQVSSTNPTSYAGWGATNFVFGNLRRVITSNTSTYEFPVAKGTAGTDYFLIEVINGNMTGTTTLTGSVTGITEGGFDIDSRIAAIEGPATGHVQYVGVAETAAWTLTPNIQPTGGTYDIRAYIANFSGLSDNQFGLLKRSEGSTDYADWDDAYPAVIPADDAAGRTVASGYAQRSGYTSFSQFGIGLSNLPLPVELVSFDAVANNQSVVVTWETSTESDNDFFTVERSTDGVIYESVGYVRGAGNSSISLSYEFTDNNPLEGTSYYRLVQTDYDGDSETFAPKAVTFKGSALVRLYPSPASSKLNIAATGLGDTNSKVEIYSMLGELMIQKDITSDNDYVDVSQLPSGLYTVSVGNDNFNHTEVIVVTK